MNNLRYYRKQKGLTQRELASLVEGLSYPYVSKIEAGYKTLTYKTAQKIAVVLGVPVNDLIGSDALATSFRKKDTKEIVAGILKSEVGYFSEVLKEILDAYKYYDLEANNPKIEGTKKEKILYEIVKALLVYFKYLSSSNLKKIKDELLTSLKSYGDGFLTKEIKKELTAND